jgi:hypothetical protein
MKKILLALTFLVSSTVAVQASAEDACRVSLCMFGYLNGENDSTCRSAIKSYFSILVYKHGKIKWGATANKRLSQLNSCPGADRDQMKEVNDTFGKAFG